jgi:succinyl-CoA synthetase alpha subunit
LSILIDRNTKIIVQNITGREGLFHSQQMLAFPSNIVAGVTPGRGGEWVFNGKVPIFDTVKSAVEITGGNASIIFVPAQYASDAILESVDCMHYRRHSNLRYDEDYAIYERKWFKIDWT